MPVFISFFMGLREMANVPVDSLRYGGIFWFEDLTVPDQFFALPVITSLTLWATIEVGSILFSTDQSLIVLFSCKAGN